MTDIAESSPPPTAAPAGKSSFQRLTGVLFAPVDTFMDIARRPDILVPLLVIVAIGYVSTFLLMPRMDWSAITDQQIEAMQKQNPNMSQEDMEKMSRVTSAVGKAFGWAGPVLAIIWYVILAGVLLLAFRIMGGEGNFKQAFSVSLYAQLPLVINGIILAIVAVARGSIDPSQMATVVKSNPAFLVDMKVQPVLFSLLSTFDIFTIWTVVLLIIGFAAASRSSKAKSAAIVISLWVVMILIKLGFAALSAARMNA